jgi:hypothetical protein
MVLAACGSPDNQNNNNGNNDRPGESLANATLIFDSSFAEGKESLVQEPHMSDENIYPENIAEVMTILTGLDFVVRISVEDGALFVEWNGASDLFKELDAVEPREEFSFNSTEAMRWFMLDSLWRTFMENYSSEITDVFYVTSHIHDDITTPSPFDYNAPYKGSPFYVE